MPVESGTPVMRHSLRLAPGTGVGHTGVAGVAGQLTTTRGQNVGRATDGSKRTARPVGVLVLNRNYKEIVDIPVLTPRTRQRIRSADAFTGAHKLC
jgi:hypothetical protein